MSHDYHLTQSRSLAAVAVALVVLSLVASTADIGVVAGQTQNGTNTSTADTGTTTPAVGSTPDTGRLNQSGSGSANGTTSTQNGSSSDGEGSGDGAPRGNTSGLLDGSSTWNEYASNNHLNGTNGSANGSGNQGGSGGGDGVLGTIGGIAGGVYDFTAGIGDFVAGSTDEWFGKTVSGFFNGARAFFGWMFGFFIEQGASIIDDTISVAVRAMTMTPHANNVGNFYQNPTNAPWEAVEDTFEQTGLPLARFMWLLSLAYVMVFGNQFGVGTLSYAKEKQAWIGLAISVLFISEAGWTLTNIAPHVADVFTQSFTSEITASSTMDSVAGGMVVLFVLLLIYFELSAVAMLMIVAAFRILVIIGFAPFVPALIVAMYSPFGLLSWIAKAGVHIWLVLLIAAIPSTLLLDATFTMAESAAAGNFDLLGSVMVIPLIVGGLLASALMPFLLWKASSSIGSAVGVSTPGSENSQPVRDKMSEYRDKAARPNRFQRGLRGKEPVNKDDGGTGAHRAGKATRNAPGKAKAAGGKAKNAPGAARAKAQNTASSVREASSSATNRASKMSQKVTRMVSR